jgi:hypothetical protein
MSVSLMLLACAALRSDGLGTHIVAPPYGSFVAAPNLAAATWIGPVGGLSTNVAQVADADYYEAG